ncbi:hypothetical protein [Sphingomonas baiyangensis]|uniref:hypothetical protein n=1 Tax=Sphingomonas baiyangensis TaxID=2572576 RepID=UPI001BAFE079|nr:hypothetical protein [Sphingomonas baiyangensis]
MKMPPVTPQGVLRELGKQPSLARRIARGWMAVGSLLALLAIAMAVAHFAYGVPIQNKDTGTAATDVEIASVVALFVGGGLLFVALGYALRRWSFSQSNDR